MITRLFLATLALMALVAGGCTSTDTDPGTLADTGTSVGTVPVTSTCEEDEPCWDPATMGNGLGSVDPNVDTTVCYESPVFPGVWLSDYSESGYCTFGYPLDTDPATIGRK